MHGWWWGLSGAHVGHFLNWHGICSTACVNIGIYQSAAGMMATAQYQSQIASNLSRQVIPGHRQAVTAFEIDTSKSPKQSGASLPVGMMTAQGTPLTTVSRLDFTQGALIPSDDQLSVAIQGGSFFTVADEEGNISYTRNGQFKMAPDGSVRTNEGAKVLLEGGSPFQVVDKSTVQISSDGRVSADGAEVGRLGLAHFANPGESLMESGPGRMVTRPNQEAIPGPQAGDRFAQGMVEGSNTNTVDQMVRMISVFRSYEANQKALNAHDENNRSILGAAGRISY